MIDRRSQQKMMQHRERVVMKYRKKKAPSTMAGERERKKTHVSPQSITGSEDLKTIKIYESDFIRAQEIKRSTPSSQPQPSHAQIFRDAIAKLLNSGGMSPTEDQIKTEEEAEILRKFRQFEGSSDELTRNFVHQLLGISVDLADNFAAGPAAHSVRKKR